MQKKIAVEKYWWKKLQKFGIKIGVKKYLQIQSYM